MAPQFAEGRQAELGNLGLVGVMEILLEIGKAKDDCLVLFLAEITTQNPGRRIF